MLAIWPRFFVDFGHISTAHAQKCQFPSFRLQFDNAVGFSDTAGNSGKFRQSESIYGRFGQVFFAHAHNRHYLCFRAEIFYHRLSQRHRFPIKGWKFLRFNNVSDNFSRILLRMRRKSYFSATILITPLNSATPISSETEISAIGKRLRLFMAIFLCACAESSLFVLPGRNLLSSSFSPTSISYKEMEISAISQHFRYF